MKKLVCILVSICMCFALCACGKPASTDKTAEKPISKNEKTYAHNESEIGGGVFELDSTHAAAEVVNNSDQFLTAEVHYEVFNENNQKSGSYTQFVNNLAKGETLSEAFLVKQAAKHTVARTIKSYSFTAAPAKSPEITVDNVLKFIRLTYEDFGDIVNHNKEIVCELHNLSDKYFSGEVVIVVKNTAGEVVGGQEVQLDNLKPYANEPVYIVFPILDEYTVDYATAEFKTSLQPIA